MSSFYQTISMCDHYFILKNGSLMSSFYRPVNLRYHYYFILKGWLPMLSIYRTVDMRYHYYFILKGWLPLSSFYRTINMSDHYFVLKGWLLMSSFYQTVIMRYHYYFILKGWLPLSSFFTGPSTWAIIIFFWKGDYQCHLFTRPSTYSVIIIYFERVITNVVFLPDHQLGLSLLFYFEKWLPMSSFYFPCRQLWQSWPAALPADRAQYGHPRSETLDK